MPTPPYHHDRIRAIRWCEGALALLDQRLLPGRSEYLLLQEVAAVAHAIATMVVRGAPAIGITAAYGVVLAARARYRQDPERWRVLLQEDLALLAAARPTAVNLCWALARMERVAAALTGAPEARLLAEAQAIHAEDIAANHRIGELGAALVQETPGAVLTHCNTGSLATGGYGTALGVIRSGFAAGSFTTVYADETRPWLQGARLTAWELVQDGIPVTLLADGAASHLLRQGQVKWVIVGADRIAANGDVANKIGTYHSGGFRSLPRRAFHGGGADVDHRHDPGRRRRHSYRTAPTRGTAEPGRPAGGGAGLAGLESGVRYHPGGADRCPGHRAWRGAAT